MKKLLFTVASFLFYTLATHAQTKIKWQVIDYPHLHHFLKDLSKAHESNGQKDIGRYYPVAAFEEKLVMERLWVNLENNTYRAEMKLVTASSLDTNNLKQYQFHAEDPFKGRSAYAPAGKKIVIKRVHDSIFVFPYYWEKRFNGMRDSTYSVYKIFQPLGNYFCKRSECQTCSKNTQKPLKRFEALKITANTSFTIIDTFDTGNAKDGHYFEVSRTPWKPIEVRRLKELLPVIGEANLRPTGRDNFLGSRGGMNLNGAKDTFSIIEEFEYNGLTEPYFRHLKAGKGIKVSFNAEKMERRRRYYMKIFIDPRKLRFGLDKKAVIPIILYFSDGLFYKSELHVYENQT